MEQFVINMKDSYINSSSENDEDSYSDDELLAEPLNK